MNILGLLYTLLCLSKTRIPTVNFTLIMFHLLLAKFKQDIGTLTTTHLWISSLCKFISVISITWKNWFSISLPKTPPGIFRKNFLRTLAMVYTLKLSMFMRRPVCKKWISFFIAPWWPGALKTSLRKGASLFNFNINTCSRKVNVVEK